MAIKRPQADPKETPTPPEGDPSEVKPRTKKNKSKRLKKKKEPYMERCSLISRVMVTKDPSMFRSITKNKCASSIALIHRGEGEDGAIGDDVNSEFQSVYVNLRPPTQPHFYREYLIVREIERGEKHPRFTNSTSHAHRFNSLSMELPEVMFLSAAIKGVRTLPELKTLIHQVPFVAVFREGKMVA